MSGHTPGPWGLTQELERGLRDEVAVCYGAAEGGATYVVAERSALHSSDFRAMRQANARLIAAAPDLLSVAHGLLNVAEYTDYEPDSRFGELVTAAEIAIAKATGGTP